MTHDDSRAANASAQGAGMTSEHRSDADDIVLAPADAAAAASVPTRRTLLAIAAAFLLVFHLLFALFRAAGHPSSADASALSLGLRAAVAGAVLLLLRSSVPLSRRGLLAVEAFLFGAETLLLLHAQYTGGVALIDARDLVDAVALAKNGVFRAAVLMLTGAILVPHAPAVTGRIALSIAAALVLCHGLVLHHADTARLEWDDVAGAQIVMANALFLIAAAGLAALAAWRAGPGRLAIEDRTRREG